MKKVILSVVVTALLFACNKGSKNNYTISGKLINAKTGDMIIIQKWSKDAKNDTAYLDKDGKFSFKGNFTEPTVATLLLPNTANKTNSSSTIFFIDADNISINGNADSSNNLLVVGGKANEENNKMQTVLKKYYLQLKPIGDSLQALYAKKDTTSIETLQIKYTQLEQQQNKDVLDFINANSNSYAAAFYAYLFFNGSSNLTAVESVFTKLSPNIKESYFGLKLKEVVDNLKVTGVGGIAPEFTLQSLDGKTVSLSSFKGKYVLIDFWASWCSPCRQENPNVVNAYKQFKDKNFTIVGVSLDEDKAAWQAAVIKDNLTWTHVSDLKGWNSTVAAQYGVQSIPANFLLNTEGRIIAKDLRGGDLVSKLNEVLK